MKYHITKDAAIAIIRDGRFERSSLRDFNYIEIGLDYLSNIFTVEITPVMVANADIEEVALFVPEGVCCGSKDGGSTVKFRHDILLNIAEVQEDNVHECGYCNEDFTH